MCVRVVVCICVIGETTYFPLFLINEQTKGLQHVKAGQLLKELTLEEKFNAQPKCQLVITTEGPDIWNTNQCEIDFGSGEYSYPN